MFLLDTNICIYAVEGVYPYIAKKLLKIHPDSIKISTVTVMELEYGVTKSKWGDKNRAVLRNFLASFDVIPFTGEDALLCGKLRAELIASGTSIGAYDLMIATQGLSRGLTVVTHNIREFERIPNLKLIDWAK